MTDTRFGFLLNNRTIQLLDKPSTENVFAKYGALHGLGLNPRPVRITIHDYIEEENSNEQCN